MDILDFPVASCDHVHTLAGRVYLPDHYDTVPPRGIFHIVHGMTEHIARYDRFMRDLCAAGWIVCGYDNLGHGHTVNDPSELGYIAKKNGHDLLATDVGTFADAVCERFGTVLENDYERRLPYVLMGHSMGSFIVRYAVYKRYIHPDRLIIMGTGGPNPMAGIGLFAIRLVKMFRGDKHISPFLDKLAFGSYNARFVTHPSVADGCEWLSADKSVRERYLADPLCTFKFTVSAMGDLVRLTRDTNKRKWFRGIPKDIPILLVSGSNDPVGDYGKGIRKVRRRLQDAGVPVTCRLYEGMRHEILNDTSYPDVLEKIRRFTEDRAR